MRRLREERGAVAIMMALVICMVLVPLGALAVDLGVQRVARSDMQSVADIVALDMARDLDGGAVSDYDFAQLRQDAQASVCRNQASVGHLAAASVCAGADGPKKSSVTFRLGVTHPGQYGEPTVLDGGAYVSGYFEPVALPDGSLVPGHAATDVPTAVQVLSSTQVQFGLANGLPDGGVSEGGAVRAAVATSASSACFQLGSYAAAVDSGDSDLLGALNDILGLNLSLLSYQGLASEKVSLADLAADSHIGGVDNLLTTGVSFHDLVQASIDLLDSASPGYDAALTALGAFADLSGGIGTVALADQLSISPTDEAALATKMSLLDILSGAVLVAEGPDGHAVDVPNLWAHVSGLGSSGIDTDGTSLHVIQGLQRACGRPNSVEAHATASQLVGNVAITGLNSPSVSVPGLANLQTGKATANLHVNLGNAAGQLVSPPPVHCGTGEPDDPDTYSVQVSSDLAEVGLTVAVPVTGDVELDLSGIPGIGDLIGGLLGGLGDSLTLVNLDLIVDIQVGTIANDPPGTTVDLKIPPNDVTPVSTGSGTVLSGAAVTASIDGASTITVGEHTIPLADLTDTTNQIAAALIGPTSHLMVQTVAPLVSNINGVLTGPLSDLLGLTLAGADVYAVPRPSCSVPQLVG